MFFEHKVHFGIRFKIRQVILLFFKSYNNGFHIVFNRRKLVMQTESPKKKLTEKIGERKLKKAATLALAATSCGDHLSSPSSFMNKSPVSLNHLAQRNDLKKNLLGHSDAVNNLGQYIHYFKRFL